MKRRFLSLFLTMCLMGSALPIPSYAQETAVETPMETTAAEVAEFPVVVPEAQPETVPEETDALIPCGASDESDDYPSGARRIVVGQRIYDELNAYDGDERDCYGFTLSYSAQITIVGTPEANVEDFYMSLYDADGNFIAGGFGFNRPTAKLNPGYYRVWISAVAGRTPYSFYLSDCSHPDYRQSVTAPSCTKNGYTEYVCRACGGWWQDNFTEPSHKGTWEIAEPPTCTQSGMKEKVCTVCSIVEQETIPALGHNSDAWTVISKETCTQSGSRQGYCNVCKENVTETTPALGHSYGEWFVELEPTCSKAGQSAKICSRCEDKQTMPIRATLEHDYGIQILKKAPTSTAEGEVEMRCSGCNNFWSSKNETLPMVSSLQAKNYVIPEGITVIDSYAFENYKHLESVTIPDTVTEIRTRAFSGCEKLNGVILPDGVTKLGISVFSNCKGLTEINIPDSVKTIETTAFAYCENLSKVTLGSGLTSIGSYAFDGCSSLTQINIPASVTSIGDRAFFGCKINQIHIADIAAWCAIDFQGDNSNPATYSYLYLDGEKITHLTIPEGVSRIKKNAFSAVKMTDLTVPSSVTHIEGNALNILNLENVYITDLSAWCRIEFQDASGYGGFSGNPLSAAENLYLNGGLVTKLVIPEGISAIKDGAFYCFKGITEIQFPDTLEQIGFAAFQYCENLTNVFLPESLAEIGKMAFYGCGSVGTITIPNDVAKLGLDAFGGCKDLKKVYFLGNAPVLEGAFANALPADAYYPAENETWTEEVRESAGRRLTWNSCAHNLTEADCNTRAMCQKCGAAGNYSHSYLAASCTAAETCTRCGITKGSPLEHSEALLMAEDPTCTTPGKTEGKQCVVCKKILVEQAEIPSLGHAYAEGICTVCGEPDPDYVDPTPTITRISGTNRIKTAIASADKLKEVLGVEKFNTIVVADAMNFPDALSGSYLAAAAQAPILLYANGQTLVTDYIKNNLVSGGKVYILGGTGSVSGNIVSILEGIACERVSGSGRYGTSLAIIQTADAILGTKPDKVLICDGTGFADSLSASATGLPILLVNGKGNSLRDDQKAYLESVRGAELYVIGGEGTIIPAMMDALKPYDADVERIYGSGRELTSAAVARTFFPEAKAAALASSLSFPDGLSGGPVAYAMGAPLLLTRETKESVAADYVNSNSITNGYVIGGTSAVFDVTANKVFGIE